MKKFFDYSQQNMDKRQKALFRIARALKNRDIKGYVVNFFSRDKTPFISFPAPPQFSGKCAVYYQNTDRAVMAICNNHATNRDKQYWKFSDFGKGIQFIADGMVNPKEYGCDTMYIQKGTLK